VILHGDCLEIMPTLADNPVDAIITDPPYGLKFMGKDWDHSIPGVHFWLEALRVAKPGCHLLAFGGTRTFHRLACAIEDAGWEIRDTVMWVYGSGFPKSHDVGKAVDKSQGNNREVLGEVRKLQSYGYEGNSVFGGDVDRQGKMKITRGTSAWEGWGTALKPAWEPIILARKPIEGTVAENVQKWGCGALNIDGCRVGVSEQDRVAAKNSTRGPVAGRGYVGDFGLKCNYESVQYHKSGRWAANLIHDGSDEVLELFPQSKSTGGINPITTNTKFGQTSNRPQVPFNFADSGSAARFFYCAKASKADRDEGCEGMELVTKPAHMRTANGTGEKSMKEGGFPETIRHNHHPTVKPIALMRYLCRLVTPPGGLVLDPFCGSGSTGKAAALEGFRFIGIEKELEYVEIAKRRISCVEFK